jgi:hypothetical protein
MTVRELIAELERLPGNLQVYVEYGGYPGWGVIERADVIEPSDDYPGKRAMPALPFVALE